MHFNCRNLNGTVLLQTSTASCLLYTWEQTNSSNKFAANLNMKGIFFTYPVNIRKAGTPQQFKTNYYGLCNSGDLTKVPFISPLKGHAIIQCQKFPLI